MMNERRAAPDDQMPWLEAVDDEDVAGRVSATRMFGALLLILLAAAIIAGTFFWLGQRDAGGAGGPELIRAEASPYKVRPEDPGGLDVAGQSETAFRTSAGEDTDARLNIEALPETPVAPAGEVPKRIPPNETKEPVEQAAPPSRPDGGSGSVVQLGAYRNQAQAERAWNALSARFPDLGATTKLVVPFSGGYRLRAGTASSQDARRLCQALQAGGENCFVAN